jgi:hypothetical protein
MSLCISRNTALAFQKAHPIHFWLSRMCARLNSSGGVLAILCRCLDCAHATTSTVGGISLDSVLAIACCPLVYKPYTNYPRGICLSRKTLTHPSVCCILCTFSDILLSPTQRRNIAASHLCVGDLSFRLLLCLKRGPQYLATTVVLPERSAVQPS